MGRTVRFVLVASVGFAMASAGCSASVTVGEQVIPKSAVEAEIAGSLEKSVGQRPDAVECPGDLAAREGRSIKCVLHAGADRLGVTATVTSASIQGDKINYKLDVKVDDKPMG